MKIAVIGLGYVGAVTAVCLARDGHRVIGVDIERKKVELLLDGKAPIIEEGLAELTAAAVSSGNLSAITTIDERVLDCDLIFVCVGTPSAPNGSQNLAAVERVAEQLGAGLRAASGYPVIVLRSTVPPGTTARLVRPVLERVSGKQDGRGFGLCFQPEFLREGSSVQDYYKPPFTIVGSEHQRSVEVVRQLFGSFAGEFIECPVAVAEMMKLACNAFHATKVTFANEIGRVCRGLGVDAREVMSLLCRDTQLNISTAYLRPGFAYGGSCLPKDLRALQYLAQQVQAEVPMLGATQASNRLHIEHAAALVQAQKGRKVGLIGLSFKAGTDDLRESPLVSLAEYLIGKGYELHIYDPAVSLARLIGANKQYIEETIPHVASLLTDDLDGLCERADVVVVGFKNSAVSAALTRPRRPGSRILDLAGLSAARGLDGYEGICW
jgi:GDP-mannose 6-dehydrogenase